jgi:hypothetical protein
MPQWCSSECYIDGFKNCCFANPIGASQQVQSTVERNIEFIKAAKATKAYAGKKHTLRSQALSA